MTNALNIAEEQLSNCRAAVEKLLTERNEQMKKDYAELAHKIPELLQAVETSRSEEEEFLTQVEADMKAQIEQLKKEIAEEREVFYFLFKVNFYK